MRYTLQRMRSVLTTLLLALALLRPACDAIAQDSFIPEAPPETREDLLKRITQRVPVMGLAMAQDGVLASAGDVLRVWDGINGGSLISLVGLYPTPYRAAAFSPDGTSVVGLSLEGEMNAWAIPLRFKASYIDRQESAAHGQNKAHYGAQANALAYSPNSRVIVSAASDTHPIKVWNADTGALIRAIDPPVVTNVTALAFSPDGAVLAFGTQHDLVFLKTSDWSVSRTIKAHDDWINAIAFTPDGKTVASVSDDKTAKLWKTDTGEPVATLTGHTQAVRGVAVSPDGDLIATASLDKTVKVWRRADGSLVGTINHTRPVYAVAFTEPGTELATGSADNTVRLWRVPDWKLTQRMTGPQESIETKFLFEADEPSVNSSESPLAFQPFAMGDVLPKVTNGSPPPDLASFGNQLLRILQAGQVELLETLFVASGFEVDGPAVLQDREALQARFFDTTRLRALLGNYLQRRADPAKVDIQRFKSLQEIIRGEGATVGTQLLDRKAGPVDEDAATVVVYWKTDPAMYGLVDYPRFSVARRGGTWRVVGLNVPLDISNPTRAEVLRQRTGRVRSFVDQVARTLMSDAAPPAELASTTIPAIVRENRTALAFEIQFAKNAGPWLAPDLDAAEIAVRWDGDPSDYKLAVYPTLTIRLENGSWRIQPQ